MYYTKTIPWLFIYFLLLCANVSAKEPITAREALTPIVVGNAPLTLEQEQQFAEYLEQETKRYLRDLRDISYLSFKGRSDISPENAIALKDEVDGVTVSMESMLESLQRVKNGSSTDSTLEWMIVARQISTNIARMDDLAEWGLIKTDYNVGLSVALPGIFDKLIFPKVIDLMQE